MTPIETKKVIQKTTITPSGRKSFGIAQKIKSKIDSELTDLQARISPASKLVNKSKMESDERKSKGSSPNLNVEREVYSSVTSSGSADLRSGEKISEKSISSLDHSLDDEKESQSNLSEQMVEQLKIENEQNSNLPVNLSPEILEKAELESINTENPLVSKWIASEATGNIQSHETSIDSIPNEINSDEMLLPGEINENQRLAGNKIETESKLRRLLTCESSTAESEIIQIGKRSQLEEMFAGFPVERSSRVEDQINEKCDEFISSPTAALTFEVEKLTLSEHKLSEISNAGMLTKIPETMPANNFFSDNEMMSREAVLNETECDKNEFVAINGKILELSPERKLKGYDSAEVAEIYPADSKEEILVAEKSSEEIVEEPNPIGKGMSSLVSSENLNSVDELESTICYTETEFPDNEREIPTHFTQAMKLESATDQATTEHTIERLSELAESILVSVPETSMINDESLELSKSEISLEQLEDLIKNAQELSNTEYLNNKIEIVNSVIKKEEQEPEKGKGSFQVKKVPDYFIDEKLKYDGKNTAAENSVVNGSLGKRVQQPDNDTISKYKTEEKSKYSSDDASLTGNSYSKIKEEITENTELQQENYKEREEWLGEEIPEIKSETEGEITNIGLQNDILQIKSESKSEVSESAAHDSLTQQLLHYVKNSVLDDALLEASKTIVKETEPEIGEMVAVGKESLSEAILLSPENLIIEGLASNSEPVIVGIQESQPFILTPLEKQESDVQANALTLDTMSSNANDLFEKDRRTEEVSNKSTDEFNSAKMEFNSFERIIDSLVSDILKSDITWVESNSEVTLKEKFENPAVSIPANNNTEEIEIRTVLPSEAVMHENLEKTTVAGKFKYGEGIPKIVVCSDTEIVEQYQMDANQQIPSQEEIEDIEQSEIFRNKEVISSLRNDASEELDKDKPSVRGYLNEFSQQDTHDVIQNPSARVSEEVTKALDEETEQVEIGRIAENQHLAIKTNDSDKSKEISESYNITREPIIILHPYHTNIAGESEERQNNGIMISGHELSVEHDIPSQRINCHVVEKFSEDAQRIGQVQRFTEQFELKVEKGKLQSEIPPTTCNKSFTNNMSPKYHLIVNGLTEDGKLILSSVSYSMLSSGTKLISYFPPNNETYETTNGNIPPVSDRNGNPEWKVYDMQHSPSDVLNESNICAADVNANISAIKHEVHIYFS